MLTVTGSQRGFAVASDLSSVSVVASGSMISVGLSLNPYADRGALSGAPGRVPNATSACATTYAYAVGFGFLYPGALSAPTAARQFLSASPVSVFASVALRRYKPA